MLILSSCAPILQIPKLPSTISRLFNFATPFSTIRLPLHSYARHKACLFVAKASFGQNLKTQNVEVEIDYVDEIGFLLKSDRKRCWISMEERLRRKRNKILHTKTGLGLLMKVTFNKYFSNSYIWFEFYNSPLEKEISSLCDTIRSWHIVGRLGGCNSMNIQVTFGGSELENWKENLTSEDVGCSVHKI
ncbi:hypothetical protein UlMin_022648 [Ulmus minor]